MNTISRTLIFSLLLTAGSTLFLMSCGGNAADKTSIQETEVKTPQPKAELISENTSTPQPTGEVAENTTGSSQTEVGKTAAETKVETVTSEKQEPTSKTKSSEKKIETATKEKKTVKEVIKNTVKKAEEKVEKPIKKVTETVKKPVEKVKEVVKKPVIKEPVVKQPAPTNVPPKQPVSTPKKPTLSHDTWNQLTGKYISSAGKVNYSGIKGNQKLLNEYIQVLENNPPQSSWARGKTIAYWINAYNAYTIKLIVDNHPVNSITDLDGGNPWKVKRIKIGGKTYSLDQIEKEILIKQYKEPRVHFAVNCAAKSCPPILNKAWTASNLETNLERSTRNFINNTAFNDVSNAKNIKLSKIFDWYAGDFGDVISFVNKYASSPVKSNAKISYNEYNWGLNN